MNQPITGRQAGGALISALISVVMLATMALGLSSVMLTSNGVVIDTEDREHAILLAEQGLAIAYNKIATGQTVTQPNGSNIVCNVGTFSTIQDNTVMVDGNPGKEGFINDFRKVNVIKSTNAAGRPVLLATGTVEKKVILGNIITVSRTLEGVVGVQSYEGGFAKGAFGLATLDIGGNFMTDSYDSSKGPYGLNGNKGAHGDIGTNGALTYHGSFSIMGDATPGPGQPPVVSPNVTGSGAPLAEAVNVTVPPYVVPAGATNLASQPTTISGANGVGAPPKDFHIDTLTSKPQDTLLIDGKVNLFVDGAIDLKGNIVLKDQNSVLNIYQKDGTLTVNGGGQLNTGFNLTIPAQTVEEPAQTVNHAATSYTVNRDPSNQAAPVLGPHESISGTVTAKKGKTTYIAQYIIAVEAYSEVIPAYTRVIPEQVVTYNGGIPSNFNIISNSTQAVKINGGADYYGTLVAPYAEVTINGNAAKYGAVLGSNMRLLGTGDFHNDTAARSPGLLSKPIMLSVREVY